MLRPVQRFFARSLLLAFLLCLSSLAAQAQTLNIWADSSLTEALTALAAPFEAENDGVKIKLQFGASGTLLSRMGPAAPADVLVTAGEETAALGMQRRLLLPDASRPFASNRLVLVVPAARATVIRRLSDLGRPEVVRIAMGREATVPAGRFARSALDAQRLWPSVQRKIVFFDGAREALQGVGEDTVDAGMLFATEAATAGDRVKVIEELKAAAIFHYAHAAAASGQPELAQKFIAWLRGGAAQGVLLKLGFGPP